MCVCVLGGVCNNEMKFCSILLVVYVLWLFVAYILGCLCVIRTYVCVHIIKAYSDYISHSLVLLLFLVLLFFIIGIFIISLYPYFVFYYTFCFFFFKQQTIEKLFKEWDFFLLFIIVYVCLSLHYIELIFMKVYWKFLWICFYFSRLIIKNNRCYNHMSIMCHTNHTLFHWLFCCKFYYSWRNIV